MEAKDIRVGLVDEKLTAKTFTIPFILFPWNCAPLGDEDENHRKNLCIPFPREAARTSADGQAGGFGCTILYRLILITVSRTPGP